MLENLLDGVRHYGPCPTGLTPKACFEEVITYTDFYSLEQKNLAPYIPDLLRVMKSDTVPKPAASSLPSHLAEFIENPSTHLVRSEAEIRKWMEDNTKFKPYWDPTLASDRGARLDLYRTLAGKQLITYRKKITAKVGIFLCGNLAEREFG